MTHSTLLVLRALMAAPDREMYGLEIMRGLSMGSGTVYPLLERAGEAGWVTDRAETIDPQAKGRPPRRYYRITDAGIAAAMAAIGREQGTLAALGITSTTPESPEPLPVGGVEIPVTVDDRQPPGVVGVVSRGADGVSVSAFRLGRTI